MAQTSNIRIPTFYRIWFTWVDAIISGSTAVSLLLKPNDLLSVYMPLERIDASHHMLAQQSWGLFGLISMLVGGLLRQTDDVAVWKWVQAGVLLIDFSMVATVVESHQLRGVVNPRDFNAMDWSGWVLTIFVIFVRSAFLANVGLKPSASKVKKTS